MKLTVRDIRKIWEHGSAALVAGEKGIDKVVDSCNMMEQPDIKPWLRENTLMITTGYVIRNDKEALLRLIQDLNDAGASALAIKTRFFDEFPKEALELAEKLEFPLFFLNNNQGFEDQVFPVMSVLAEARKGSWKHEEGEVEERNQREKDARLFSELTNGKIKEDAEIEYWRHSLNWPVLPVRVVVFSVTSDAYAMSSRNENMNKIYNSAKIYLASCEVAGVVVIRGNECICMIQDKPEKDKVVEMCTEFQRRITERFRYKTTVGISGRIFTYRELKNAWSEARDAVRIAENLSSDRAMIWYEDEPFEQMILRMSREDYGKKFVEDTLELLENYDRENESHLEKTLECLIENMGSKKKAAEELYLHRNTMSYRVKQIEKLMNCDLSKANDLLRLGVAVKIKSYIKMHSDM